MSFYNGILNLTNWSANVILPTLAAVFCRHCNPSLFQRTVVLDGALRRISMSHGVWVAAGIRDVRIPATLG